jgi:hypothetical protein
MAGRPQQHWPSGMTKSAPGNHEAIAAMISGYMKFWTQPEKIAMRLLRNNVPPGHFPPFAVTALIFLIPLLLSRGVEEGKGREKNLSLSAPTFPL